MPAQQQEVTLAVGRSTWVKYSPLQGLNFATCKNMYIYTVLNSTTGKHKVILDNGIKKKMIEKSGPSSQTLSDFQAAEGGLIIGFCETSSYALSKMYYAYSGTLSRLQSP